MNPWDHPVPPLLYKYLAPQRIGVLKDCKVRFSQRSVFDDDHELMPNVSAFGTVDEIWRFILAQGLQLPPGLPANVLVQLVAHSPKAQAMASRIAITNMSSLNQFGIFCLTDDPDSERMWSEYGNDGRGFVIAFDTSHKGFKQLTSPGKVGKVSYTDEPFGTYLGMLENDGVSFFFRKRMKYEFEKEWRSVRALSRLESQPGNVFLSTLDPASVKEILIRVEAAIETDVKKLVENDSRYSHVVIRKLK